MNINDIMAVLGIVSAVAFIVCAVLYYKTYQVKTPNYRDIEPGEKAAIIIGFAMALIWTIALWPTMTGSTTGAYVVYVNGVASSGGVVNFFNGFVPLFIFSLLLVALPRIVGFGVYKLLGSGKSNTAGKRSVPALIGSIFLLLVSVVFLGSGIGALATSHEEHFLWPALLCALIGVIPLFFGIRGIVRFVRAK